jgi:predicted DNA-binding transcriptional regulator AlpA
MNTQDTERLLTRAEVEQRFGISKRYLEVAICKGEGPRHVKIGRSVRYRATDICIWIEQCTVERGASYEVRGCR